MEQSAGHLDGAERRCELVLEHAAEAVGLAEFDVCFACQSVSRHADARCQLIERLRGDQRALLLGVAEILELPRDAGDAFVENIERNAARLTQHLRRGFRIAERLVVKAPALAVHLEAALGDRRPGDQDVVRGRDRAVALIAGKRGHARTERLAPQHRIALIARMAEVERIGHLRDMPPHQFRVSAVAVAGEHQRAAADGFAGDPHAFDEAVVIREQRLADTAGQDRDVARLRGAAQAIDQLGAGAARQAVHAMRRMARVVEIGNHLERHVVGTREPLDGRPRVRCDGLHQLRVGLAVRFAGNVFGEALRRILDAPLPLKARARRRDEAGRQRCRSAWHRIALDHHRIDAGFAGGKRGAKACGARADDQQRHFAVELDVL